MEHGVVVMPMLPSFIWHACGNYSIVINIKQSPIPFLVKEKKNVLFSQISIFIRIQKNTSCTKNLPCGKRKHNK
jgi:hypothetical protein